MLKINKGKRPGPRRILLYGEPGVGKSSLACRFPNPIVLNLEDGVKDIECDSTDVIRSYGDFHSTVVQLSSTPYHTIVIDTADWLEKLLFNEVASKAGKETIDDIGFGKGYQAVEKLWRSVLEALTHLSNQGRHVVLTCHEKIQKFADPEGETFSYYEPKLHEKGSGLVCEWATEVLFCKYKTFKKAIDEGFNKTRSVAIGGQDRVIVCNKQAAIVAKNRLGMPDELPLKIESFYPFIQKVELKLEDAGNVAGIVNEGSSKQVEVVGDPF